MKGKNNKTIIVCVIGILLIIVGCVLFFMNNNGNSNNNNNSSNSNNNNNSNNSNNSNNEEGIDTNEYQYTDLTAFIYSNNEELPDYLKVKSTKNEESYTNENGEEIKYEYTTIEEVYINNKEVFKNNSNITSIVGAYAVDDCVILLVTGTEARSERLLIYQQDGTLLQEIHDLDEDDLTISINFTINEDVLEFTGSKIFYSYKMLITENGKKVEYDLCENKDNLGSNYLISARYRLVYSGNHKFNIERIKDSETYFESTENWCKIKKEYEELVKE